MVFPVAGRGRPRKNAIPAVTSVSAQAMLETVPWRKVSWRRGTKGGGRRHQGPPGLRTGASAAQRRTRPRSLRRPVMEGPASPRAAVHDRLRLPPVTPPQPSQRRKKESAVRHRSQVCRRSGKPSLTVSPGHPTGHASIVDAALRHVSQNSAKVVLEANLSTDTYLSWLFVEAVGA